MENFSESIVFIKEYDIIQIGKSKAKKDNLFEEIEKYDSTIKEETRKIVNESSIPVYALVKKGIIKGICLFESVSKDNLKILKHIKTVYTDEVPTDTREKFDKAILIEAKDYVSMQEYDKVILNDKVVQVDRKATKNRTSTMSGGFIFGFIFGWLLFHDFFWGLFYGFIFSPTAIGLDVLITNKRGRKKK